MKLLSFIAACFISFNAMAFNGTIGRSTALSFDGSVNAETIEKKSINVKNSHSSALLAGMIVALDLSDDDGASVNIDGTSGFSPLCIVEVACAVGALCPCQTYGKFEAALFDVTAGSAVAGKRFYMSTSNPGYIAARASENGSEAPGGIFYDAAAASGSVQVFIK